MHMSRTRKEFENMLLRAFDCGLNAGYGIEHTDINNEEMRARKRFAERHGFKHTLEELGYGLGEQDDGDEERKKC